jgi:hypothetical protein
MKLALLVICLVACKRYDREDLVSVCSKGAGYEKARAYDPSAAGDGDVPVAMVYKYAGINDWTLNTPSRFDKAGVVAPSKENHAQVALALCVEQQPGPFGLECAMDSFDTRMEIGGGEPRVDVKKTGGRAIIKAHGSHYIVTVREARTARVLATRELDIKAERCPMIVLGGSDVDYAPIEEDDLIALLAPHLPKAAGTRLLASPRF